MPILSTTPTTSIQSTANAAGTGSVLGVLTGPIMLVLVAVAVMVWPVGRGKR